MKKILLVALAICTSVTPVLAARTVYLKDGGTITAKSVWRTKDKVHVLVNRDTLTEFSASEINLKRTFARKHRTIRKPAPISGAAQATAAAPAGSAAAQKPSAAKPGVQLPNLPNLPDKKPENLLPKGEEGTIRKHKKEMTEKMGE